MPSERTLQGRYCYVPSSLCYLSRSHSGTGIRTTNSLPLCSLPKTSSALSIVSSYPETLFSSCFQSSGHSGFFLFSDVPQLISSSGCMTLCPFFCKTLLKGYNLGKPTRPHCWVTWTCVSSCHPQDHDHLRSPEFFGDLLFYYLENSVDLKTQGGH